MTATVRLPRATPVYVVGDSHSAIYDDRLVWAGAGIDRTFVLRTLYCPGLRATACLDADGKIAAPLLNALVSANLLVDVDGRLEPFHLTADPHWHAYAGAQRRWPRHDPAIVLTVGGLDCLDVITTWPYETTIEPPVGLPPPDAERWPVTDPASSAASAAWFRERFAPLASALTQLRELGFGRLALLSIAPPVVSDRVFRRVFAQQGGVATGVVATLALRHCLVLHANMTLRSIAQETGVQYIDRWPIQAVDGVARRDLLNDSVHIVDAAADESALGIVSAMFRQLATHAAR